VLWHNAVCVGIRRNATMGLYWRYGAFFLSLSLSLSLRTVFSSDVPVWKTRCRTYRPGGAWKKKIRFIRESIIFRASPFDNNKRKTCSCVKRCIRPASRLVVLKSNRSDWVVYFGCRSAVTAASCRTERLTVVLPESRKIVRLRHRARSRWQPSENIVFG